MFRRSCWHCSIDSAQCSGRPAQVHQRRQMRLVIQFKQTGAVDAQATAHEKQGQSCTLPRLKSSVLECCSSMAGSWAAAAAIAASHSAASAVAVRT